MSRLLLIDDDDINDLVFTSILEEKDGIEYHYESDGWKALQHLSDCEKANSFPDIIFVDLKMPQMDGFMFIEHFEKRFHTNFPSTKLIILTSSILLRDQEKSRLYPSVQSLINKPVTDIKLFNIINAFQPSN